jgi:hypothetical protein
MNPRAEPAATFGRLTAPVPFVKIARRGFDGWYGCPVQNPPVAGTGESSKLVEAEHGKMRAKRLGSG